MCIGNRSATLFEMGEWKKCLDDIEGRYLFTKLEPYLNFKHPYEHFWNEY